jgi:hypothetical protein
MDKRMVSVIEIDLGALGVKLPRGEVAMVVAQPFADIEVDFSHEEPFTWTAASKVRALEYIDTTLAVSLQAPQGAEKTHFTVFPECMLPGLEGVDRITTAMHATTWPAETVVIGGVDGLTKEQFAKLVAMPGATFDSEGNSLGYIHDHHWVNCVVIWAKLPSGEVRSWVQPKLDPAFVEQDVTRMSMYRGRSVFVFKGNYSNVVASFRFATFLCYDWIGHNGGKRLWEWLLEGLTAVAGPAGVQLPLTWLFVPQCNPTPSHASFMGQVAPFYDSTKYTGVNRDETCLVMANIAGKAKPGRAERFGQSAVIVMPNRFSKPTCQPTYCNGGNPLRGGTPLENFLDALFRERGACIHSFLVAHPASLPPGSAGRRFAVREAMVHPFNGLVDPRAPGSVVPAVVKWVNDELDDPEKSLATKYHAAPLNPAVGDAHTRTVAELRVLKPFGLEETVKFASMSASKRSPDEWASVESQSMKHILHTFSILDVAQYPRTFHGQGAQATIQNGNSSMEVIAVIGASHEDCDKHVRERLPEHKGKLVLVSRDEDNNSWDPRLRSIYDQVPDEPTEEAKITQPTSAIVRVGYKDLLDAYRSAANEAALKGMLDAKLT